MFELLSAVFTIIGTLAAIAAVVLLSYFCSKWLSRRLSGGVGGGRYLTVLDRISVAQDKSLMIVKIGERLMLIGVSPNSVSLVTELDGKDLTEIPTPPAISFKDILKMNLGKKNSQDKGEYS